MQSSLNKPQNSSIVALLDVDDTLIKGSVIIDLATDTLDTVKIKIQSPEVLNYDLIDALLAKGIRDIYLFTDMILRPIHVLERAALMDVLRDKGFQVHAVITPADLAWHLPDDYLNEFYSEKNLTETKDDESLHPPQTPGCSFKAAFEALQCDESKSGVEINRIFTKSNYARNWLEQQVKKAGILHLKGKLFQYFLESNPIQYDRVIVCDDREEVITAVKTAALQFHLENLATVHVNNHSKRRKREGETMASFASYLSDMHSIVAKSSNSIESPLIDQTYTALLKLTLTYLNKKHNSLKKRVFRNLRDTLLHPISESPLTSSDKKDRMIAFTNLLQKTDRIMLSKHRTARWKRYIYNAASLLTLLPLCIRMGISYYRYRTVQFWKPDAIQALQRIEKQADKILLKTLAKPQVNLSV